jgi:DNA-binding MarR family transcriptional regulator
MTIQEFADTLDQLLPLIMREFNKRQADEVVKGTITVPQLLVLDILFCRGEVNMSDLARAMAVTTAAMTGIVERLVTCGYAERKNKARDRRVINVSLTAKGRRCITNIKRKRRTLIIKVFSKLSGAERGQYLAILSRVRDVLVESNIAEAGRAA